jgi:hypothetical protein
VFMLMAALGAVAWQPAEPEPEVTG